MSNAIVVGSGPNGLACAVALAREGVSVKVLEAEDTIGGGTRTSELTVPGVLHDHCSAVHPMAVGSPFLKSLDLGRHGLEWGFPEVDLAHPLDDGSAGVLLHSLEDTVAGLGEDGAAWNRLFGKTSRGFGELTEDILQPVIHVPKHPIKLTRFGLPAAMPATILTKLWKTDKARALFGGVAAHALSPLNRPMSSSVGMALTTACHAFGWAVAKGGSKSITDALAAVLIESGGTIETGVRVTSIDELDPADAVIFDTTPRAVLEIAGDRLPVRVKRAYGRYKYGPAAFKIDLAIEGGVPWANEAVGRAGTVHVAGRFEEMVLSEREVHRGRMPERPYVLACQQHVADPSRSNGDIHPFWAYAHVPAGYTGDATPQIMAQLERFAPGVTERIVGRAVRTPADLEAGNANYIDGDIVAGANTPWQVVIRPRLALDPYSAGAPGIFMCSAATPPGGGVHGMNGYNAAQSVLGQLRRS